MTSVEDSKPFAKAVVIGGSIGGSAAAAALSRTFAEVLVLDKDALPDEPMQRTGVPHGYQFHALTVGGSNALEFLLPGITDDFLAHGAHLVDVNGDIVYGAKSGWFPRFPSELKMFMMTRHGIENIVRDRAKKLDNVTYEQNAKVTGLLFDDGRVSGVRVERAGGGVAEETADLVVDTSGRGSRALNWLEEGGFPRPAETVVDAKWGYTTAYLRPPADWKSDFAAYYLGPTVSGEGADRTRGAAMWKQEGGVWVLTAQGCAGDYPPLDQAGMYEFIRSIGDPTLNEVLDTFELVSPPKGWRNTANRLRDFVGVQRRPENFVAIGDAVAAFNPVYGQGMSSAAFAARHLAKEIGRYAEGKDLTGFPDSFYPGYDPIIQDCWTFSTSADNNIPGVEHDGVVQDGERSPEADYADRVLALATEDPEITRLFRETIQLIRTAEWLGDPALQQRVQQDWDRLGKLARTTPRNDS